MASGPQCTACSHASLYVVACAREETCKHGLNSKPLAPYEGPCSLWHLPSGERLAQRHALILDLLQRLGRLQWKTRLGSFPSNA